MTTHCPTIVNRLINSQKDSYLELGIDNGLNFNAIFSLDKYSVDFRPQCAPNFAGTSDAFFAQNTKRFDYIFIDANHDYDFVVNDFINSLLIADKMIILHDMNPPTKMHSESGHCSDSYKLLTLLKKETECDIFTLAHDFGLSFVPIPNRDFTITPELVEKYRSLSYEDFCEYRDDNIKLYDTEEMIQTLKNYQV